MKKNEMECHARYIGADGSGLKNGKTYRVQISINRDGVFVRMGLLLGYQYRTMRGMLKNWDFNL